MATREKPIEEEILKYFQTCSNWGKWGPDDQLGTMNYLTQERRKKAAPLFREGVTVSCARPLTPDTQRNVIHLMSSVPTPSQPASAMDFLGVFFHGQAVTHVDALGHFFWQGKMYNNVPAEAVNANQGATKGAIDLISDGVIARGVLLDIPRVRGVQWLEPGDAIYPDELEAAERAQNVRVEPGDVLCVRTGAGLRRLQPNMPQTGSLPGLQGSCVPWVHQRQVAMLGSDGVSDVLPTGYAKVSVPFHFVGIVAMGLWLIDNMHLEELAAACERFKRWEFLMTIGPLRITGGTGSPANPIAVF